MKKFEPKYSNADVEILQREICFDSFLRVNKLQIKHKLFNGGWSDIIHRELSVRAEAVGVLLFDPGRDEVVMVRQFRVGAMNVNASPWMLELVAGMVDKDESLEAVAIRETKEESDCNIIELVRICDYYNSPGASDEKVTLFCGKIQADNAGGVFGLAEEHEDIEVVCLSSSEAINAVETGQVNNAMSIIALQWLALNKEKIAQAWL